MKWSRKTWGLAGSLSFVSVLGLAVGCGKDEEDKTVNGVDASLAVSSLNDAQAQSLCEAVVERAQKEITREVVCTLAGVSLSPGFPAECEIERVECEAIDHGDDPGTDAATQCAGIAAEDFAGCGATVGEVDTCMAAIIAEVSSVTCEDPDGRVPEADVEAACKPLLDDPGCSTATEAGQVVAGSGYIHAMGVGMPGGMGTGGGSGTGGSGMGGAGTGTGGTSAASGGTDSGTGGMAMATGGTDSGTGGMTSGSGGTSSSGSFADCTTCSMLDCLLSPRNGACLSETDMCYTQVHDQQAGRVIERGCKREAALKDLVENRPAECDEIESHVLSDGVTCVYACDGKSSANCNHPPQLLPDLATRLYE